MVALDRLPPESIVRAYRVCQPSPGLRVTVSGMPPLPLTVSSIRFPVAGSFRPYRYPWPSVEVVEKVHWAPSAFFSVHVSLVYGTQLTPGAAGFAVFSTKVV